MKRILLLLALLTLAASLHAQTSATFWLSSQKNGADSPFPSQTRTLTSHFDDSNGFGASIARRFGSFSGELAVFRQSSSGSIRQIGSDERFSLGDLKITPITGMLRYHFRPAAAFDMHIGAGAAYVLAGDLDSADIRAEGLTPIEIGNELTTVVGAGITYDLGSRWGIALDARYLPLSLGGRPDPNEERIETSLDPLLVSAGLRFRF